MAGKTFDSLEKQSGGASAPGEPEDPLLTLSVVCIYMASMDGLSVSRPYSEMSEDRSYLNCGCREGYTCSHCVALSRILSKVRKGKSSVRGIGILELTELK